MHFNVSVTSRDLQTSRLGLVSAGEANVSVSSRSRPVTSRAHPCQADTVPSAAICQNSVSFSISADIYDKYFFKSFIDTLAYINFG